VPSTHFGASWHGRPLSVVMDSMPTTGAEYNMRALEVQCSNHNGIGLSEWYNVSVQERAWKVAGMLVPVLTSALYATQQAANMHAKAKK